MRSPTDLAVAFRATGLKVTPQRQLLFKLLHENVTHPSAEALFAIASEQMPGISLRTVYQTLNDLAEMGELVPLDLGTGAARFDPNVDDHHHVVCDTCGQVRDVHVANTTSIVPTESFGFASQRTQIVFRGLCALCAASPN